MWATRATSVLLLVGAASAACNVDKHHPENGGYYIEGIAGIVSSERDGETGKRADNTTWAPNSYYPHAELKLCTGMFCSEEDRVNGSAQYVVAHTCALLRFSYDSSSTVYEMPDLHSFTTCDFFNAYLWGAADKGDPYFDYNIEDDHDKEVYYFASKAGCSSGQKVAVEVVDDYANNALQCSTMGAGSSRIQHCDCNHQLKGTTLIDPCHTAFVQGCLDDMPDDTSCCPGTYASYDAASRQYVNGGTCIPKSKEAGMKKTVTETINLCASNATACSVYEGMAQCPSMYNPVEYDPKCNQWKTIQKCTDATGSTAEECNADLLWILYKAMDHGGHHDGHDDTSCMFDSKQEADTAAQHMGCTGSHQMGERWMVGETHGSCSCGTDSSTEEPTMSGCGSNFANSIYGMVLMLTMALMSQVEF